MQIPPPHFEGSQPLPNFGSSSTEDNFNDVYNKLASIYSTINTALSQGSTHDIWKYISDNIKPDQLSQWQQSIESNIHAIQNTDCGKRINSLQPQLDSLEKQLSSLTNALSSGNASDGIGAMRDLQYLIGDPNPKATGPLSGGLAVAFIFDPHNPPYFPVG